VDFDRDGILQSVIRLLDLHVCGSLGGEIMPEDANPQLDKGSAMNHLYFTLPMSLNYQRNSYALWKSALASYCDTDTQKVFSPKIIKAMDIATLGPLLTRHKVALQPNKQPVIWQTLCASFADLFDGDIRNLFAHCGYSAASVKRFLLEHKKCFPYLSGAKISNYWLYVMQNYTDLALIDRENISVAPDTHVIQASVKVGLISPEQATRADVQAVVADRWQSVLRDTGYLPIDVHTPLWLWSRGKFSVTL